MALRYSYDESQGGWVLDNKGHFQTPFRIAQYYGQDVYGFKMNEGNTVEVGGLVESDPNALVLGYSRDDKNQCYIDPQAPRNPYESEGCPPLKRLPRRSAVAPKRMPKTAKPPKSPHTTRDMIALVVVFLLSAIAIFAFTGVSSFKTPA